jgi:hypothetical protein
MDGLRRASSALASGHCHCNPTNQGDIRVSTPPPYPHEQYPAKPKPVRRDRQNVRIALIAGLALVASTFIVKPTMARPTPIGSLSS